MESGEGQASSARRPTVVSRWQQFTDDALRGASRSQQDDDPVGQRLSYRLGQPNWATARGHRSPACNLTRILARTTATHFMQASGRLIVAAMMKASISRRGGGRDGVLTLRAFPLRSSLRSRPPPVLRVSPPPTAWRPPVLRASNDIGKPLSRPTPGGPQHAQEGMSA